ncbi:MAG: hypothetical protein AAGF74_08510 [Pseudomonadota bacterium]
MSNNWILDFLADLKMFARQNDLTALAEQLDDTTLVAATELAAKDARAATKAFGDAGESRSVRRNSVPGGNA